MSAFRKTESIKIYSMHIMHGHIFPNKAHKNSGGKCEFIIFNTIQKINIIRQLLQTVIVNQIRRLSSESVCSYLSQIAITSAPQPLYNSLTQNYEKPRKNLNFIDATQTLATNFRDL